MGVDLGLVECQLRFRLFLFQFLFLEHLQVKFRQEPYSYAESRHHKIEEPYALLSGGESEKVMMAVGTSVTEKFARGPSLSDEPREKDCEKEQKQGRPVSFFAEN